MMDGLIRWALNHRPIVLIAGIVLMAFGVMTVARMPVDVFPDLTAPTVTVITEAHGMAPTELESQVTFPIETALNGAAGVRRVRSSTAVGISIVWVEFEWGTDIGSARRIVGEKVMLVSSSLPAEVEPPVLAPESSMMGEILMLSLNSTEHSPIELRVAAETVVRRRLLAVPGVSQVVPIGGGVKQFQVLIEPVTLQNYGVVLDDVITALEESNENVSAGVINEHGSEWLVTGVGRLRTVDDIRSSVVTAKNGVPVTVGQLGKVQIGVQPKRGEASANGRPAVILGIQKQPGVNTLELTRTLDGVLDDIVAELPSGMVLDRHVFRQADFISVAIQNVRVALAEGVLLVVVVVLLFLANIRATLITVTAIPLSLVVSVLVLHWFDVTINTMSLGGMAIAIGALVDDAVIDVENVFRRLRLNAALPEGERQRSLRVVLDASVEIRNSIVFATLIIALVFVPIFFLTGVEGRLLRPLGISYLVALLTSLVVAVTVTPVLCSLLLPKSRAVTHPKEVALVRSLKRVYGRLLTPALNHPWLVTGPALLLLLVAGAAIPFMGRSFLPEFNEGALTISAVTLPGTSLPESDALGGVVEEILVGFPEVASVGRRTGRAELDEHALGVESTELEVTLKMQERSKEAFLEELRDALSVVPGMNITIGQPISHRIDHMLSGTRANIAVKIFGPNLYRLRDLAEEARHEMEGVEGVVDLSVEQQADEPIFTVRFNRQMMGRHGLSVRHVAHTLEAAVQGVEVSTLFEDRNSYDLVVKLSKGKDWLLQSVGDLLVDTPSGAKVPLSSLATLVKEAGPNTISREQVGRKIVVQCNVAGRDLTSVVEDIRERLTPLFANQSGYRVEYGGQFESAAEATRSLILLGLLVVVGIGVLLHMAFGCVRDALLVMLNLPLALIGGVAGVYVSGGILSVASLIGFITVFGIATRNGIMLVSHIRHLQLEEGVTDLRVAVHQGALERLTPILMTALSAGLALIPLALGGGEPGNEIQTPMAIVILFGLLTSMVLNMLIVPTLYMRFGRPATRREETV